MAWPMTALEAIKGKSVAVATLGLRRIASDIATILEADVRYRPALLPGEADAIAGWGHKPTAARARRIAERQGLPYLALEDGFLRSVRPGRGEPSSSYVADPLGIYYDTRRPSLLEALIRAGAGPDDVSRARAGLDLMRRLRLSKYNDAPPRSLRELGLMEGRRRVLVIDQTYGDASIAGAGADDASFARALAAAISENPGSEIVVKTHPETLAGTKRGCLNEAVRNPRVTMMAMPVEPACLVGLADSIYTVSSLFGFEALIHGKPVTCFGTPFYAGWGLTDDRRSAKRGEAELETLFHAAYLRYSRYLDAWTRAPIDFETAAEQLAFLRQRFLDNGASVCLGITAWKRKAVARFLDGRCGAPHFARNAAKAIAAAEASKARIVVWASRETPGLGAACAARGIPLDRMEDGFLRSVGLGASFVAPASLIIDDRGIYYDPTRPSGFEHLAETVAFTPDVIARARALRATIRAERISKYNEGALRPLTLASGTYRVLVPGQVEDDASIRHGTRHTRTNLALLAAARARHPEAVVIYKPHPDVEAGLRKGRIAEGDLRRLASAVATGTSMPMLLDQIDRVETMTSLTGFEALLRGKKVTVHGQPFYAGWGLTEDLEPVARRRRRLTLDELVALTLILYPRYCDPASGRPCPPETVIARFRAEMARPATAVAGARRRVRLGIAWAIHNLLLPLARR